MKKSFLINSEISHVISTMGHTDSIVVADAGLPIPKEVKRIDLAISQGVPGFFQTLEAILSELKVEEIVLAEEMVKVSNEVYEKILDIFKDKGVKVTLIPHEEFKKATKESKAIVRTGEFTPYANILLKSGVVF